MTFGMMLWNHYDQLHAIDRDGRSIDPGIGLPTNWRPEA